MLYLKRFKRRLDQSNSGVSKFVQDGSYLPKTKDQNKQDWRVRKGFSKDQSKHRTWCKCGRELKQFGNRQHRRWVKKLIKAGKYDHIYWHQDMFISSWDAC